MIEPYFCNSCRCWWRRGDAPIACLVLHQLGQCCHVGDAQLPTPENPVDRPPLPEERMRGDAVATIGGVASQPTDGDARMSRAYMPPMDIDAIEEEWEDGGLGAFTIDWLIYEVRRLSALTSVLQVRIESDGTNLVAEMERWRDRATEAASNRDRDWILALAQAMGQDSGLRVPVVPDPEVVRLCLEAYAQHVRTTK